MTGTVDIESRLRSDDHLSLRLWLRLLACTNLVEGRARAALRTDFATSLARFDLLSQLERADGGLKMVELGRRLMVTGGNVTRLVDQLESEGLVGRRRVPEDGRAYVVRLTAAGRRSFQMMAARHETWIVSMFSVLSQKERRQLYDLLAKLKGGLTAAQTARG